MNKIKQIQNLIKSEEKRQENSINLIASENYAPEIILQAISSKLTNKYAEGYPGKRYYAGCENIDQIESLTIDLAKKLFKAEHANVQPHSGAQANMALYATLLNPGDTIMSMNFQSGGHLTHGQKFNFSGKFYNPVFYNVDPETHLLNYNEIYNLAQKTRPKLIITGASSYSRQIDFSKFREIADSRNAYLAVDMAHIAGLVATNLHPSPVPYADIISSTTHKTLRGPRGGFLLCKDKYKTKLDKAVFPFTQGGPAMNIIAAKAITFDLASKPEFIEYQKQVIFNAQAMAKEFKNLGYKIVSNGTDTHLFVVDLRNKNLTGNIVEKALEKENITVNRNCIPFDPQPPSITSGIRIGTPAITTQGFKEKDAQKIAHKIHKIISNIKL